MDRGSKAACLVSTLMVPWGILAFGPVNYCGNKNYSDSRVVVLLPDARPGGSDVRAVHCRVRRNRFRSMGRVR